MVLRLRTRGHDATKILRSDVSEAATAQSKEQFSRGVWSRLIFDFATILHEAAVRGRAEHVRSARGISDINLFCYCQSVIDFDVEILSKESIVALRKINLLISIGLQIGQTIPLYILD